MLLGLGCAPVYPCLMHAAPEYFGADKSQAIIGLQMIASKQIFALDKDMNLQRDMVCDFLREHAGQKFLLFGFTFMAWQHFYKELLKIEERFDLSEAFLMTSFFQPPPVMRKA